MIALSRTTLALVAVLAVGLPAPATPLRVMTFNIHAGHGDLARTAEVIDAAAPDVVALQEVDVHWGDRSGFEDQAAALAAATGMDVRFAPIYSLEGTAPGGMPREYGVAILSRLPIIASENHLITRLSTQGGDEPRPMPGFLQVTVQVGETAVDVFSTHLDFRPDPSVRRTQVGEMLTLLKASAKPTLLLGDLNAPPEADELQPLFGALEDVWDVTRGEGHTYPAGAPVRRIDYVLVSPGVDILGADVVPTDASDHRPVVADLEVPQG